MLVSDKRIQCFEGLLILIFEVLDVSGAGSGSYAIRVVFLRPGCFFFLAVRCEFGQGDFDARGKPSTVFPRGRHVETERKLHVE